MIMAMLLDPPRCSIKDWPLGWPVQVSSGMFFCQYKDAFQAPSSHITCGCLALGRPSRLRVWPVYQVIRMRTSHTFSHCPLLTSRRFWDCCKPSCSWSGKAAVNQPVFTCDANNNWLSSPDIPSGCNGGSAYACADQTPWAVSDKLAYGFAATSISGGSQASWCCACYAHVLAPISWLRKSPNNAAA